MMTQHQQVRPVARPHILPSRLKAGVTIQAVR